MANGYSKSTLRKLSIEQLEANKLVTQEIGKDHLVQLIDSIIDEKQNPRYPKKYIGAKGKADIKNVRKLRKQFDTQGLDYCERCGSRTDLTFAHRMTRQFVKTKEEHETVSRICLKCHIEIEGTPTMKEEIDSLIATRDNRIYQGC